MRHSNDISTNYSETENKKFQCHDLSLSFSLRSQIVIHCSQDLWTIRYVSYSISTFKWFYFKKYKKCLKREIDSSECRESFSGPITQHKHKSKANNIQKEINMDIDWNRRLWKGRRDCVSSVKVEREKGMVCLNGCCCVVRYWVGYERRRCAWGVEEGE